MLRYVVSFFAFLLLGFGVKKALHVPTLRAAWILPVWLAVILVGYVAIDRLFAATPICAWIGPRGGHWLAFALGLFPIWPPSAAKPPKDSIDHQS